MHVEPRRFAVVEGLLGYSTRRLRDLYDVRVFLAPPEELRRRWKVQRDCSRRGYTTDQVLEELDRREPDSEAHIRPQRRWADILVCFAPAENGDEGRLDATLTLRSGLVHPDLEPFIGDEASGVRLTVQGGDSSLWIAGDIDRDCAARLEEGVWDRMHFASHLRSERLGEFTIGTQLHRSESLAIVQVLILYHLVTARAAVSLGRDGSRADRPPSRSGRSARSAAGPRPAGLGSRAWPTAPRRRGRTSSTAWPRRRTSSAWRSRRSAARSSCWTTAPRSGWRRSCSGPVQARLRAGEAHPRRVRRRGTACRRGRSRRRAAGPPSQGVKGYVGGAVDAVQRRRRHARRAAGLACCRSRSAIRSCAPGWPTCASTSPPCAAARSS